MELAEIMRASLSEGAQTWWPRWPNGKVHTWLREIHRARALARAQAKPSEPNKTKLNQTVGGEALRLRRWRIWFEQIQRSQASGRRENSVWAPRPHGHKVAAATPASQPSGRQSSHFPYRAGKFHSNPSNDYSSTIRSPQAGESSASQSSSLAASQPDGSRWAKLDGRDSRLSARCLLRFVCSALSLSSPVAASSSSSSSSHCLSKTPTFAPRGFGWRAQVSHPASGERKPTDQQQPENHGDAAGAASAFRATTGRSCVPIVQRIRQFCWHKSSPASESP